MQDRPKHHKQYSSNISYLIIPNYFALAASRGSEVIGANLVSLEIKHHNQYHQHGKKTQVLN